jgi:hypothetical protein
VNSHRTKTGLSVYNVNKPCHLFVEASQNAVGAVLKQPGALVFFAFGVPVYFHSTTLRKYELSYAIY